MVGNLVRNHLSGHPHRDCTPVPVFARGVESWTQVVASSARGIPAKTASAGNGGNSSSRTAIFQLTRSATTITPSVST